MTIYFVIWDEMDSTLHLSKCEDLVQADSEKEALEKEMGKNAMQKKNTSNYKLYKLGELLDKYGIKIVETIPSTKPVIIKEPIVEDKNKEVGF